MRRNATKVAAAVLSLAVTMTSVNIPTSAAAATKKVKLNKTKATLTVGKSTTLKLKQGTKVLKATFTSNKPKIAKVGKKTGKVTAKKKGTATITATYKKKKYKCKITVKAKAKPTVKPTAAPTTEPTAAPTTEPTAAPTDAPSTEPTAAPADTVGAITSVEAKSATTIVATFESALPATAVLTLTKGTTDTGVKAVIDEARKTATFTSDAKYVAGTYTVTATAGESKQSKDVEVLAQKATDIVIKSTTALVNPDKKAEVFVYYDVTDQYGESMKASTTITWTSGTGKVKSNKTTGCLTITRTDGEEFKYGDDIYLVGVDIKNGITVQKALKVGMERALDKIDFIGFINVDNRNTILKTLPKDFAVNKYRLLFTAYDQEGNPMNASTSYTDVQKPKVTFIGDNPTLIKPEFKAGELYTINGIEYCSVTVEPGMYVDKGGEVNITAISNTTRTKTVQNFVIGDAARLQSLVLSVPDRVVADGDKDVNIPFVAKDIEGKEVTNYETIVRSTNTLKLTATEGTLTVYETETGAAAIKWDDGVSANDFTTSSSHDDVNRNIALVTVVVGGESNNLMMEVYDTRRPVAISKVKLNDDDNNMITESNQAVVDVFSDNVTYMDQYNEVLDPDKARSFFNITNGESKEGIKPDDCFDGHEYGVKVDYSTVQNISDEKIEKIYRDKDANADKGIISKHLLTDNGSKGIVLQNKNGYKELTVNTKKESTDGENTSKAVVVDNLKYSVVRLDVDKKTAGNAGNTLEWSVVDAEKNIDYTIVPVSKLSNLDIKAIKKVKINTEYSKYANGEQIDAASSSAIALNKDGDMPDVDVADGQKKDDKNRDVIVTGTYDGKVITIPNGFYSDVNTSINYDSDKALTNPTFVVTRNGDEGYGNALITGLVEYGSDYDGRDAIRYGDLYDFNTAKNTRKDVRKNLFVNVYNAAGKENATKENLIGTVKTAVTVSDEERGPVKIVFIQKRAVANKLELNASDTNLTFDHKINRLQRSDESSWTPAVLVTDQYGDGMLIKDPRNAADDTDTQKVTVEYSVTNPVENKDEFAHLSNSFATNRNGSGLASIDGVEIKDTFDLTATVIETGVSVKVPVTMGSDECAILSNRVDEPAYRYVFDTFENKYIKKRQKDANNNDLSLRDTLGYDR